MNFVLKREFKRLSRSTAKALENRRIDNKCVIVLCFCAKLSSYRMADANCINETDLLTRRYHDTMSNISLHNWERTSVAKTRRT